MGSSSLCHIYRWLDLFLINLQTFNGVCDPEFFSLNYSADANALEVEHLFHMRRLTIFST